ncbi:hypothetical protein B0H65DRAFT_200434 [Neurospora tetraspora]|uniref:Uncharacterized protein n=1 Tax=Neurospora tetraspora TaxID=94610 RepID=A0AAE0JFX2_9PEZI|nr:hypothetical protein B0H65DRAFT_200434 [Neurospora tetraspora]
MFGYSYIRYLHIPLVLTRSAFLQTCGACQCCELGRSVIRVEEPARRKPQNFGNPGTSSCDLIVSFQSDRVPTLSQCFPPTARRGSADRPTD